jgi:hypothetical protein
MQKSRKLRSSRLEFSGVAGEELGEGLHTKPNMQSAMLMTESTEQMPRFTQTVDLLAVAGNQGSAVGEMSTWEGWKQDGEYEEETVG